MTRSIWKGPFIDHFLFRDTRNNKKLWSRRSMILPQFVGSRYKIHNGKKFISVYIKEDMVGHKFGEFVTTKRHGSKGKSY